VPDSTFPVSELDGQAVVTTPDEIDIGNAGLLREALLAAAASRRPVVIVDMSGTEFCDSTGLNVLVRAHKQAEAEGYSLRLVVRGAALTRILNVTGVGSMFEIYDSLGLALAGS
jgi:anti-sigma B factor antagonist